MSVNQRPSGVTALVILEISLGVLLSTRFMFALFPTLAATYFHFRPVREAVLLVFATVDFILAYCLWNGKTWAWITALVFALLGIVFSGFMLFIRPALGGMASLIIELLILYYLMQPKVQRHFRRSKQLHEQQV